MTQHGDWRNRFGPGAVAGACIVAFWAVLTFLPAGDFTLRAIDDLGQLAAAAAGAACCLVRARRCTRRWRLSWTLIGLALASWAAGEAVWSYYELLARRETPFPSAADLGYLLFPVLVLPGILVRPSPALAGPGRVRVVLDGLMVAGSLLNVSWATSLGAAYGTGGSGNFPFIVGLAYPVSDVVMLTVAVIVLSQAWVHNGLPLLVAGLAAMAVADSGFSYLTAIGGYHTGSVVDIAWFAAFLLIGLSAVTSRSFVEVEVRRVESPVFVALPYVLVAVGAAAVAVDVARGLVGSLTVIVGGITVLALLARQLLTLLDNRRLALDVIAQQAELRFRAFHDALTGLANRALFVDRITHAIELHKRDARAVSVVILDLDDFKAVNDTLGHSAGDALLVAVAGRLISATRAGDTVARLGGDEFAVLLEDDADAEALAGRLLDALDRPVIVEGRPLQVRASIGTATVDAGDPGAGIEDLIKRADLAMYRAKRVGKGTPAALEAVDPQRVEADLEERLALAADIGAGRIRTALQPIVFPDGQPFAYEAFARWEYAGAQVPPPRLLDFAERAGLLPDLDSLMIRNALAQTATTTGPDGLVLVSVNVGVANLIDMDTPGRFALILDDCGDTAPRLMVEMPEGRALEDPRVIGLIARLRDLGIRIALDDFGVGYSNLARLDKLSPDYVKLDRSLIEPLDDPAVSPRLVASLIDLAHDIGAVVIGEGVETERQLGRLHELQCDAMQGYLLGPPLVGPVPDRSLELIIGR